MRYPVKALKDHRVTESKVEINNLEILYKTCNVFDKNTIDHLIIFSKFLCPHDWLDDKVYFKVINNIDIECSESFELRLQVLEIKECLRVKGFLEVNEKEAIQILTELDQKPSFLTFLKKVIFYLYDDLTVWEGCGYEGVNGCKTNSEREGINDIDWLPEPPLNLN